MTNAELLTVVQVARELNLTRRAIQHRIKVGTLKATQYGEGRTSQYLITRDEVDRAKASQRTPASS